MEILVRADVTREGVRAVLVEFDGNVFSSA
jgi:hypothetical protein